MSRARGTGCIYQRPDSSVWWIKYNKRGKTFREATKFQIVTGSVKLDERNKRSASNQLKQRLAEILTDTFVGLHVERVRVSELADDFLREYRINNRKSLDDVEARWKLHLQPFFASMRAVDVSSGLIARYVDSRQQEGAANGTINRELAALKRMFFIGLRSTPPKVLRAPNFPKLTENNVRTGFLTDAQREALAGECAKVGLWMRTMFEVGCTYGWRVSEVKGLRARHVDVNAHTIRLDVGSTKNGKGRIVTFEPQSTLYELLSACVHGKTAEDYVFTREDGKPIKDFRGTWAKVCCAAGVGKMLCDKCEGESCTCAEQTKRLHYVGLIFHDLRRTAARSLRRAGVAENVIMQIGGWRTRSVFDRYCITTENDLADAMRKLEVDRKQREAIALAQAAIGHVTVTKSPAAQAAVGKAGLLN